MPAQRTLVENGEDIIASPRHPTVPISTVLSVKVTEVSSLASFTKTSTVDNQIWLGVKLPSRAPSQRKSPTARSCM